MRSGISLASGMYYLDGKQLRDQVLTKLPSGEISDRSFPLLTKSALTFEKNGALKIALLLDNSQLGENQNRVTQTLQSWTN